MKPLETVKVKSDNEQGFVIINKSDFDDKKQELMNKPKGRPKKDR